MRLHRRERLLILFCLCLCIAACATRQPIEGRKAGELDRKLSTFTYIEEGKLVTLIVNVVAARDREGAGYMPLQIAVANNGLRQLILTRESFTLVDENKNRYPAASPQELIEGYNFLNLDRHMSELGGIVANKFAAYQRYPSNFSPTEDFARLAVVRDLVSLPKFGYMIDFIYFPEPPGGIRGHRFELFLDSPSLEDPVFVKFEVP
jgi:hypothetical protein